MISEEPAAPETSEFELSAKPLWGISSATRFAAIYFTLVFFPWPISALFVSDRLQKVSDFLVSSVARTWKPLVDFAAANIFHVGHVGVAFTETGSSDRLFDWLVNFWVLVIALLTTLVWTWLRPHHVEKAATYLRVHLRYTLGAILLTYGSIKLSQFPPPFSTVLNKSVGEETPMGLLWAFIGSSTGYTVAIGVLEVLCGGLLLFRRTTLLGSCLAFAVTLNIFLLNVFYDVPVKLFSLHLLLASLALLAPDLGRLAEIFLFNRPVPARRETQLAESKTLRTGLLVLKALFIVDLIAWDAVAAVESYVKRTAPKSAVEGIWKVTSVMQGGKEQSDSSQGKSLRWQWLTVDKVGETTLCHLWLADGSVAAGQIAQKSGYELTLPDLAQSQTWSLFLKGQDELEVKGVVSGLPTSIHLQRNQSWVSLTRHSIHWIQEAPREP